MCKQLLSSFSFLRRNCRQRRPDLLQAPIRHRRQRRSIQLAAWPGQLRSIPMLRSGRVLAHGPVQCLVRSSGDNLHHLLFLRRGMSVAGVCQYLVAHVHRAVRTRIRHWTQIGHRAGVRGGDGPSCDPRCPGDAVADVDGVRDHAGVCGRPGVFRGQGLVGHCRAQLAHHDGLRDVPCHRGLLLSLLVPGIAPLVYAAESLRQGLPVHVQSTPS